MRKITGEQEGGGQWDPRDNVTESGQGGPGKGSPGGGRDQGKPGVVGWASHVSELERRPVWLS